MRKSFNFRGYEIHSSRMWQQAQIDMALGFMVKYHLNSLIFHENDLVDQLVFPEKYFNNDILWERWPVRRQGLLYRRDYINKIIKMAKQLGIKFYLEIKEINFFDGILELYPDLRNADGTICPNHPFWLEFLDTKFTELFKFYPDIAGIIVSLGTRESPVSIAANRCHCDRCKGTSDLQWYVNVIKAIFKPIHEANKDFIVRDFAYTADQQSTMITASERVSDEIIIALKAEPHDYYPTFPINPEIGHTGKLREYIEFDTWGQFFGMGVSPMSLVEDIKERMIIAYANKAEGVWFRTDWELVNDASVHCTPSLVNLYGGAMLAYDLDIDIDIIYKTWTEEGLYSPLKTASQYQVPEKPTNPQAWRNLRDFMRASWLAFMKTGYILGHQYLESDQTPFTIEKAFEIMTIIHSRDPWDPGASSCVSVTDENIVKILGEKRKGLEETKALENILNIDSLGISKEFASDMKIVCSTMVRFAELCDITTRAMYFTKKAEQTKLEKDIQYVKQIIEELNSIALAIENELEDTNFPYYLYSRLSPQRIRIFSQNVQDHLDRLLKNVSILQ